MCSTRLMRRFPARESRWRVWLPEDASSGAVPFQEANRSRLANRWMSPTSASSRAAPEGPMPCSCSRVDPRAVTSSVSSLSGTLVFLPVASSSAISPGGEPTADLAGRVPRPDRGDQRAGLPRGQVLLGPAGQQLQQQPVQPVDDLGAGPAQLIAAVGEHAHHHQVLLDPDLDQAGSAQGGQRD